jgi:site-specific recombinase XerD
MILINFRFSSPEKAKTSLSPYGIIADFTFGKRMRVKTSIKIKFKHFNPDYNGNLNKIVRASIVQEGFERNSVIEEFKKIEKRINEAAELFLEGKLPDFENVEKAIEDFLITGKVVRENLIEKIDEYVIFKGKSDLAHRTLYTHKKIQEIIKEIVRNNKGNSFDAFNLDEDFFFAYLNYSKENNYISSTYNKYLNGIKSFLNWLQTRYPKMKVNFHYKSVKEAPEHSNVFFLLPEEVQILKDFQFSNPGQSREKDMFLFQMSMGRRDSDISPLKENLSYWIKSEQKLVIINKKGKSIINIVLPKMALDILEKYESHGKLPLISNQKRNEHLKQMFKLMNIDREILIKKYDMKTKSYLVTRLRVCDQISTHWARSSFVTHLTNLNISNHVIGLYTGQNDRTIKKYQGDDFAVMKVVNVDINKLFDK